MDTIKKYSRHNTNFYATATHLLEIQTLKENTSFFFLSGFHTITVILLTHACHYLLTVFGNFPYWNACVPRELPIFLYFTSSSNMFASLTPKNFMCSVHIYQTFRASHKLSYSCPKSPCLFSSQSFWNNPSQTSPRSFAMHTTEPKI